MSTEENLGRIAESLDKISTTYERWADAWIKDSFADAWIKDSFAAPAPDPEPFAGSTPATKSSAILTPPATKPAKVKRKRRTKAQIEADRIAAEPPRDPIPDDDPASLLDMPEEPLSQEPTYTLDDVHAVARSFGAAHGLQAAKTIFAKFNATNLATLEPEHFSACIEALKEAM